MRQTILVLISLRFNCSYQTAIYSKVCMLHFLEAFFFFATHVVAARKQNVDYSIPVATQIIRDKHERAEATKEVAGNREHPGLHPLFARGTLQTLAAHTSFYDNNKRENSICGRGTETMPRPLTRARQAA